MKGFTFIEILIVVAILAFLFVLMVPSGIQFYRTQQLDTITEEIIQALRRAQLNSMSVKNDSAFGVYFSSGRYVLFKGNSYLSRDQEEVFGILNDISFSGDISEVVFSKLSGDPNNIGNLILTLNNKTKTININSLGRINLE
jgi:prepilin-type N-terminal cleavage/methylation domain-containing protein